MMRISMIESKQGLSALGIEDKVFEAIFKDRQKLRRHPVKNVTVGDCRFSTIYDEYPAESLYDYKVADIRIKLMYPIGYANLKKRFGSNVEWWDFLIAIAPECGYKQAPLLIQIRQMQVRPCLKLSLPEYDLLEEFCQTHLNRLIRRKIAQSGARL